MNKKLSNHPIGHAVKHTETKTVLSLTSLFVLCVVHLVIVVVESVRYELTPFIAMGGLLAGGILGFIFSRMRTIHWDAEAAKVIAKIDIYGAILFVVYVAFSLTRTRLLSHFLHGHVLAVTSISILTGILFGRVIATHQGIAAILEQEHPFIREG